MNKWLSLLGLVFIHTAYGADLAVCQHPTAPTLFENIHCQDSTKALEQTGQSKPYITNLYQLTWQGWHIIALHLDKNGTTIYLQKPS